VSAGKAAPMDGAVRDTLAAVQALQARLPPPPQAGRVGRAAS
jgi:hypothetical protein